MPFEVGCQTLCWDSYHKYEMLIVVPFMCVEDVVVGDMYGASTILFAAVMLLRINPTICSAFFSSRSDFSSFFSLQGRK